MNKVPLGSQGLEVSRLALGCMGMSEFYGTADESESIATIHRAVDLGIDFIDTADMYGPFTNEILVGKAIRDHHNAIVLATKFGVQRGDKGDFLGICADRKYVKASCDASLRRLDVDHIDLYYLHRVDTQIPIEETVDAMARLVEHGKVRFIGLSEAAPETIRRGHAVHPITALQTEYSLWSRDPDEEILPVIRELGIGFVAYSPLGRGFLTGKIRTPEDFEEGDYTDAVITHDPSGGYGHPDHKSVYQHMTAAFYRSTEVGNSASPEHGQQPGNPRALYYVCFPRSNFRRMWQEMLDLGITPPFASMDIDSLGSPDDEVTTTLDVSAYVDTKISSLDCHRTQLDPNGPFAQFPKEKMRAIMSTEYFTLASPHDGEVGIDLLAELAN